ncbi:glycosyltransferase family 2 protein [Oceanobacillus iheyensis]|uniref:glycosyltransferase family 2 protein n=1 Tax=Oceanobacillus iheyensis TaxID=182710 RepID=UPI00362ED576
MNNLLISVIIPVYNVDEYIEECLNSVLNQTYKNIEIIVVNDGSTDNSLGIIEEYALKNENIKIFSQENMGQSVARNQGMKMANGKYIYFLDSDDYILPETFQELIEIMEENNLDLIRFAAESFVDKIDRSVTSKQYNFKKFYDENKVYSKEEFLELNFQTFTPSPVLYMLKKDVLVKNNIFYKPGIIHEDELFTLEVFLNSNLTMYKPKFYYKRRYRPNSTMTNETIAGREKSFNSRCIILDELNKMLENYTNQLEVKLIRKRIRSVTTALVYNYQDLDKKYKKNKIKNLEGFSVIQFFYCILRKNIMWKK